MHAGLTGVDRAGYVQLTPKPVRSPSRYSRHENGAISERPSHPPVSRWHTEPLRYVGFANELTESTKAIVSPIFKPWNPLGWSVVLAYVAKDLQEQWAAHDPADPSRTHRLMKTAAFHAVGTLTLPVLLINKGVKPTVAAALKGLPQTMAIKKATPWTVALASLASVPALTKWVDPVVEESVSMVFDQKG